MAGRWVDGALLAWPRTDLVGRLWRRGTVSAHTGVAYLRSTCHTRWHAPSGSATRSHRSMDVTTRMTPVDTGATYGFCCAMTAGSRAYWRRGALADGGRASVSESPAKSRGMRSLPRAGSRPGGDGRRCVAGSDRKGCVQRRHGMCRRTKYGWRSHSRGAERCHTGVVRQGWMARPSVTVRRAVDWGPVRVLEGEGRGASAAVGDRGAGSGGSRRGLEAVSVWCAVVIVPGARTKACSTSVRPSGRARGFFWAADARQGRRALVFHQAPPPFCAWSLISPSPMPAPHYLHYLHEGPYEYLPSVCASGASLLTAAHCHELASNKLDTPI